MGTYTIAILMTVIASILSLAMGFLLWQYRTLPSTRPLMMAALGLSFWSLAYLFQLQVDEPLELTFWQVIKQPGALFIDVLLLLFVLDLTNRARWRVLLIAPVVATTLAFISLGSVLWDLSVIQGPEHAYILIESSLVYQGYVWFQSVILMGVVALLAQRESTLARRSFVIMAGLLPLVVRIITLYVDLAWDLTPFTFAVLLLVIVIISLEINLFYVLPDAYSTVIHNNPDGVLILDMSNRVLAANPMFTTLTGIASPVIMGNRLNDVFPQLYEWMPEAAYQTSGTTETQDGQRAIEIRIIPLIDHRSIKGRALLFRDITAKKQAQDALSESETRYRTLFDQAQDAILLEDSRLAIVDANEAAVRLLGYSLAELRTMTSDVIQPQALRYETPDVKSGRFEMQGVRKDRSSLDLEVTVAPIPDGDRLLYMSILRDVTERKRTQAQLKQRADELADLYEQVSQLEQYKTEMIRMAAHDLRQPISVTMGHADLLMKNADILSEDQRGHIQSIQKAVSRANHILSDILSLERIEQQMSRGFAERFNFHGLLGDMIAQYRDPANERRQTLLIEVDPDDTLYEVVGYSPQMSEAIANLIENAIKYTPDEGQITVRLRNNGNHLIFEVRDTGYGIPKDLQDVLFRPFSRARSIETLHIEGTGLGLHLVKSIVERHGGSIIFRSVYQEGSTFGFRLPLDRKGMVIPPQVTSRNLAALPPHFNRPIMPPVD